MGEIANRRITARCPLTQRRGIGPEDNLVNQKVAKCMIERMGHSIVVVENGRLAVELAAQQRFDLIPMDLQMPRMDGFEATARIRAAETAAGEGGGHIPIIALTAHAMRGDFDECLGASMDDYISKPISLPALVAPVWSWSNWVTAVFRPSSGP